MTLHTPVNNKVRSIIYFLFAGVICYVLFHVLAHTYINHDVALNYYYTKCLLEGQVAYVDFLDMNAPTIWYLFIPPAWLQNITGLTADFTIKLFVVLLSIFSIISSVYFYYQAKSQVDILPISLILSCIFLLGIDLDFGQREHLTVLFITPTIFFFGSLQNIYKNSVLIFIISFLFIVGIAIKPLYVLIIIPLFVYNYKNTLIKSKFFLLGIVIGALIVSVIALLHIGNYIKALEFAKDNYFLYTIPYRFLLSKTILPFTFIAFLTVFVLRYNKRENRLGEMFFTLACVSFGALLIQQKGFTYHYYPLWAFTILSIATSLAEYFSHSTKIPSNRFYIREILCCVLLATSIKPLYSRVQQLGKSSAVGQNVNYAIRMAHTYAQNGKILNLSTQVDPMAQTLLYCKSHICTQFSCLWFLPVFYNSSQANNANNFHSLVEMPTREKELFTSFIRTVAQEKPELIIVNEASKKLFFTANGFDFLQYYKQDSTFTKFFDSYEKVGFCESTAYYSKKK